MRLPWLVLGLALAGCASAPDAPVVEPDTAGTVARRAWGPGFDEGVYDVWRELSREQREQLDKQFSDEFGARVHVGPRTFAPKAPPPVVIDEVSRLRPGCALTINEWSATPSRRPRPFVVIARDEEGNFRSSRVVAPSHEDALVRGKREAHGAPAEP